MHLRLLTRVHAIAAFVICSLLYFAWIYPSLHVTSRIAKAWTGSSRRIIVFGDSFSDTGSYVVPISEELRHSRDPAEGKKWTEILCEEVCEDSFPQFACPINVIDDRTNKCRLSHICSHYRLVHLRFH
jgi:hypothetical protein